MKPVYQLIPFLFTLFLMQGCAGGLIAVAGTTVAVSSDERSLSQQIEDDNLSLKAIDKITVLAISDQDMRINVVTNNSNVLLIGQVSNQDLSNNIEYTVSRIEGVKRVYNQLRHKKPIGIIQQTKDSWLTTKVKSQLTGHDDINPLKIKVVTEDAEVFLIGQVTKEMSDDATNVARKVDGVKQVIRVFEIMPINANN